MKKAKIDEILLPGDLKLQEERAKKVKGKFGPKLRKFASRIPFAEDVVAAYYCAFDHETPAKVRGTLLAALAYFILPLDLIPDFLAGFGITDDITILAAAISMVSSHMKEEHRRAAQEFLASDDRNPEPANE